MGSGNQVYFHSNAAAHHQFFSSSFFFHSKSSNRIYASNAEQCCLPMSLILPRTARNSFCEFFCCNEFD